MKKVSYFDLGEIFNKSKSNRDFHTEMEMFYDNHPHNNGWAQFIDVFDPKDNDKYSYPLLNAYLLSEGAEVGESVLLHSEW